jgi:hypothetical protein
VLLNGELTRTLLQSRVSQPRFKLPKPRYAMWPFLPRPTFDSFQVDRLTSSYLKCLFEALAISVVKVPSEPVHDALGRMQYAQDALRALAFCKVMNYFFSDRDRAGGEPLAPNWGPVAPSQRTLPQSHHRRLQVFDLIQLSAPGPDLHRLQAC